MYIYRVIHYFVEGVKMTHCTFLNPGLLLLFEYLQCQQWWLDKHKITNLDMELHWDDNISGIKQYRALKKAGMFNAVVLTEGNMTFLVSTLFVLQTFLFKRKEASYLCKVTHIWFLTIENVYNWTVYFWSHIEFPISLELKHTGP